MLISFTNSAKNKIKSLLNPRQSLFLYLKSGGCNGFEYKFKLLNNTTKPDKLDEEVKIGENRIFICNKSLLYIIGTEIDYKQDLMGSSFCFSNPKIKGKCGCGTSINFGIN